MDSTPTGNRLTLVVLRAQSGDRAALDRILECYQKELFGYLVKMLRDQNDAEDALQVTLLQAAKKIRWLREPNHFRAWIFRIASRVAFQVIRQRQRKEEVSNVEFIDIAAEQEIDQSERRALLDQIPDWLDKLTPKGREAIILHYIEGFTTEEVAQILGVPLGTTKSRISYSLSCIRKQITLNEGLAQ